MRYRTSRYNFAIPVEVGTVVFCAKSGAATLLRGVDQHVLAQQLCGAPQLFDSSTVDALLLAEFLKNGHVVEESHDELCQIREHYWRSRRETPLVVEAVPLPVEMREAVHGMC